MHLLRRSPRERFYALTDISFAVETGESLAIIGHNGAGKSTLLNIVTQVCAPSAGEVTFEGEKCTGATSGKLLRHGVGA